MERAGPKQWARLRIWQACERLEIPTRLWPDFAFPQIPRGYLHPYHVGERLAVPSFLPLYQSEKDWKAAVQTVVEEFISKQLDGFRQRLRDDLARGFLVPVKQTRETTPLDLRYNWAAKRLCYGASYRKLASEQKLYTEERVKQIVLGILKQAGLGRGK